MVMTVWYVPSMNLIFVRDGDNFHWELEGVSADFKARDVDNWDGVIYIGGL